MKRVIVLGMIALVIACFLFLGIQYAIYQDNKLQAQPMELEKVQKEIGRIEITTNVENSNQNIFNTNASIKDIKVTNTKQNIYLFYGDGCPYCEREIEFLTELYSAYQDKFNLYAFEVWHNQDNKAFLEQASKYLDTQSDLVPILVIGDEAIIGFSEKTKETIQGALESSTDLDIYEEIYNRKGE